MNKPFEIFCQTDKEAAAAQAGENLNRLLIEHKGKPVLLMLSGGSALTVLDYVGHTGLGADVTISMLDERFSEDPLINNFSQMQKLDFYKDALEVDCSFFGTLPRPAETMENLAQRWEKNLTNWHKKNPKGIIIATLGLGADGHTAGIFPYPEDVKKFDQLFNSETLASAYNAGNKTPHSQRITATLTFFKLINFGLAFVSGQDKKTKLEAVLGGQGKANELPALGWQKIKSVKIFTDQAVK